MGLIAERPFVRVLQPMAIGCMFACIALSFVQAIHAVVPSWNGHYVVLAAFIAAVEAHFSYGFLRQRSRVLYPAKSYRAVELLALYAVVQGAATIEAHQGWRLIGAVTVDGERLAAYALVLIFWLGATDTARDLWNVGEPAYRDAHYRPPADHLIARFFWGGAILLIVSGIAQFGVQGTANLTHAPVSGFLLNVLVYFLLGSLMLGQIRYVALRLRWERNSIVVPASLGSQWSRYSLVFLVVAAGLAVLLPTRYTLGLLDTLRYMVEVIMALAQAILLLVLWPFGWILGHLGIHPPAAHLNPLHRPPVPAGTSSQSQSNGLFDLLRSLLFWVLVFGGLAFLVRWWTRGHSLPVQRAALLVSLAQRLRALVQRLRVRLRRRSRQGVGHLRQRQTAQTGKSETPGAGRLLDFSRTAARQRVINYYLSMLRRAAIRGFPRRAGQTPDEYVATLQENLPFAREDVGALTHAFVEARYSTREVTTSSRREAQLAWRRIRTALGGTHGSARK
ncbi:MAG: DUF4129 domain-containing protein [Chloroflexota bacterium]